MAVTLLNTQTSQVSGQTSNTCNLGTVASAGTVYVSVLIGNSSVALTSGVSSVVDSHGNTYTKQEESNRAQNVWEALFSFDYGSAPGATTLTITYGTANGNISFTKAALDDATNTAGSFDIGANNAGLSDMSATSPDVTTSPASTAQAAETVVAALGMQSGTALTSWPPTGYTAISTTQTNSTRGFSMAMGYQAVTSTGVQSADCGAQGASVKWVLLLGAFKQASGGTTDLLTPTFTGTATFTASVPTVHKLAPSFAGAATFTAALPTVRKLAPTFAGAASFSALVPTARAFAPAFTGAGSFGAAVTGGSTIAAATDSPFDIPAIHIVMHI